VGSEVPSALGASLVNSGVSLLGSLSLVFCFSVVYALGKYCDPVH
jgi:hypothetical protein